MPAEWTPPRVRVSLIFLSADPGATLVLISQGSGGVGRLTRRRARRAIIASQRTRRLARLAQIPRGAKNACSG
jgi:hypothetical protein